MKKKGESWSIGAALLFVAVFIGCDNQPGEDIQINSERHTVKMTDTRRLELAGILGEAVRISENGRLTRFITGPESEAIRIFDKNTRGSDGQWKGEHAGKWLYAASKAAYRNGDTAMSKTIEEVVNFLVSQQLDNGYLGTYTDSMRFYMHPDMPVRAWDAWINAYILQGFIEAYKRLDIKKALPSAEKIAGLMIDSFMVKNRVFARTGFFGGLASDGVLGPFVELYRLTGDQRYLDFAEYCVRDMDKRPGTELVHRSLCGIDVSQINEGKMYEMLRVFTGLAKLFEETGDTTYWKVLKKDWNQIREQHLTPLGTPWGGINPHFRESFSLGYVFSPYGYSETCAVMDWFRFTKEMYCITGEPRYVDELERTAFNGMLGAQFPDGMSWTYHTHPNGKRMKTSPWACCSSSGPILLEEVPEVIYAVIDDRVAVNIYGPSVAQLTVKGEPVRLQQVTRYPWEGKVELRISRQGKTPVSLLLRIPTWAEGTRIYDGKKEIISSGGEYVSWVVDRTNDTLFLEMPMRWKVIRKTNMYNYKGRYTGYLEEYFCLQRGPVTYAANIMDGEEHHTDLRFNPDKVLTSLEEDDENGIPVFRLKDSEIVLKPFYMACDRTPGKYKATWLRIR